MCPKYYLILIVLLKVYLAYSSPVKTKRVCVVGAGIAGLSTARYLKEEGINFTVLEATRYVGGTWRYDPRLGTDENGLPLHTSMYRYLRTNLPKPGMELRGFPIPEDLPTYLKREDYYQYLQDYAKHFDILKHIQFLHNVVQVRRIDDVWRVRHQHVLTNETFEEEYDYVVVASGHFTKPNMPNIPGEDLFNGTLIHSHDYREPEPYRNRRVLIVGGGPSGIDIGVQVANVSKTLIHSQHSIYISRRQFSSHYIKKPDVKELNETGALFVDGTFEEIDDIIYCTGFLYDYPFLDNSSGLYISPKTVLPLYNNIVNINFPSMMVMGVGFRCSATTLDSQARYTMALIKDIFTLPNQYQMEMEWLKNIKLIRSKGYPLSRINESCEKYDQYYAKPEESVQKIIE